MTLQPRIPWNASDDRPQATTAIESKTSEAVIALEIDSSEREHKRRRRSEEAEIDDWPDHSDCLDQDDQSGTRPEPQQGDQTDAPPSPSPTAYERARKEDLQRERPGWLTVELEGSQFWGGPVQGSVHHAIGWILEYQSVHEATHVFLAHQARKRQNTAGKKIANGER